MHDACAYSTNKTAHPNQEQNRAKKNVRIDVNFIQDMHLGVFRTHDPRRYVVNFTPISHSSPHCSLARNTAGRSKREQRYGLGLGPRNNVGRSKS